MPRGLILAIAIALTSTLTAQTIDQKATDAWLITRMAQRYHVAPRPLDKEMSAAIFSQLLDALDDQHLIFLADDIRQLSTYRLSLDEEILKTEQTPLSTKLAESGKVNTYSSTVYLIFFKCNWEDNQMVKAMNALKVNDAEQARSALLSYANEGLKDLDTIRPFEGDPSLVNACKRALTFYKQAAENEMPKLTDFIVKKEEFDKMKKDFDANSNHTQSDVNAYNKAVKDINNAANAYNQTNNKVNNGRNQAVNGWSSAEKDFQDQHIPHYK